jgi:phenylpropionate dioxygenase-like ring-hydroxylating dioxygenase large terminal subunit
MTSGRPTTGPLAEVPPSLPRWWYVACRSGELRQRPLARTVHGVPLVLFRDRGGRASALVDRCPHRNAPLSLGRCRDGLLECAYHGWRFDAAGICRLVPGLDEGGVPAVDLRTATDDTTTDPGSDGGRDPFDRPSRRVGTFPVAERDGFVWVVPAGGEPAVAEPPALPHHGEPGFSTVYRSTTLRASALAAVDNALDVAHTAFLHRGLFRGRRSPVAVRATVRKLPLGVEAVYEGEPRPPGVVARLLSPEEGLVEHVDRFLLPSIAQVEYGLGEARLVVTSACTPISADATALHAAVTFRLRLPVALVRAAVTPVVDLILRQDARILAAQTDTIARFGGEHFANTPVDVLGPHVTRLVRRAERGEVPAPSTDGRAEAGAAGGGTPVDEEGPVTLWV